MLKFLSLSALTSAAVLATVAITPASAYHMNGGRYNFHSGGHYRFTGHRNFASHYNFHRTGRWAYWHHHHNWRWRHGYGWAGYYGAPAEAAVTYPAASPAPVCTCLRKDYLDDGAVRFTDACTQETAISMPAPSPRG